MYFICSINHYRYLIVVYNPHNLVFPPPVIMKSGHVNPDRNCTQTEYESLPAGGADGAAELQMFLIKNILY